MAVEQEDSLKEVRDALLPCISGLLTNFTVTRVDGPTGSYDSVTLEFAPFRSRVSDQRPLRVTLETRSPDGMASKLKATNDGG